MLRNLALLALAGLLALAATACGGGDDNGSDNGDTEPTSVATSPPEDGDNGGDGGEGGDLTLVAKDTLFDKDELEARAGEITIILDNQDAGVAHNVEVFDGEDEDAEMLGATEIANGPVQQTLTLTLEPGEYFYWCVVHPATMRGVLNVE